MASHCKRQYPNSGFQGCSLEPIHSSTVSRRQFVVILEGFWGTNSPAVICLIAILDSMRKTEALTWSSLTVCSLCLCEVDIAMWQLSRYIPNLYERDNVIKVMLSRVLNKAAKLRHLLVDPGNKEHYATSKFQWLHQLNDWVLLMAFSPVSLAWL